jgi:hypothetical protein
MGSKLDPHSEPWDAFFGGGGAAKCEYGLMWAFA